MGAIQLCVLCGEQCECGPGVPPVVVATSPEETLDERFMRFHRENPRVYASLVRLAREALARGRQRLGIKMLWERLRWELFLETTESEPALNNSYTSRYARLIAAQEPDLAEVFELRELRS